MAEPRQTCHICGDSEECREWDRGFPPDAAKRRLAKRCHARGHECDPWYRAGVDSALAQTLGLEGGPRG